MFPNIDRFLSHIYKIVLKSTINTHLNNKSEQNWPKIEKKKTFCMVLKQLLLKFLKEWYSYIFYIVNEH